MLALFCFYQVNFLIESSLEVNEPQNKWGILKKKGFRVNGALKK